MIFILLEKIGLKKIIMNNKNCLFRVKLFCYILNLFGLYKRHKQGTYYVYDLIKRFG